MIKQMAVIRRKPGMTHGEYLDYIEHVHGSLARANKLNLKKYLQNHVLDGGYGSSADREYRIIVARDSITELYYENVEAMMENFSHPYVREVMQPDGANFSDMTASLSLLVTEIPGEVPEPRQGGIKVFYFLKKAEGLEQDEFCRLWSEAHTEVLAESKTVSARLRQYIQNLPVSSGNQDYFGSRDMLSYEGIAVMWFDDVVSFRDYQQKLEKRSAAGQAFFNPSLSFFLFCKEILIFEQ